MLVGGWGVVVCGMFYLSFQKNREIQKKKVFFWTKRKKKARALSPARMASRTCHMPHSCGPIVGVKGAHNGGCVGSGSN